MFAENDIELFLQKQRDIKNNKKNINKKSSSYQKAESNASIEEFISMIAKFISKHDKKIVFLPDEGAIIADPKKTLDNPIVMYEVISRIPHFEQKPRLLEDVIDSDGKNKRFGSIWSQKFKSIIQFNIVACDYFEANKVMNTFEDMIMKYTGYFKKNGVSEIIFQKQFTDKNLDKYRQYLSVRSLQYMVVTEKLTTVFDGIIEDISTVKN